MLSPQQHQEHDVLYFNCVSRHYHYHEAYYKSQAHRSILTSGTTYTGCPHLRVFPASHQTPGARHHSVDILEPQHQLEKDLEVW